MIKLGDIIILYTGWQRPRAVALRRWLFHLWSPFEDEYLDTGWSDVRILGFTFEKIVRCM